MKKQRTVIDYDLYYKNILKIKWFIQKIKNFFHLLEAILANIFYRFPSKKLKIIGVTGTDGKTTTTHLIYHLLKTSKKKISMISTIGIRVGNDMFETGLHTTTPSSFVIQKYLRMAFEKEEEYFIIETTSHALDQYRVWGIDFEIGVLTNITQEHLDYHGNFENYVKAKVKLLKSSKIAVINEEDQSYNYVSQLIKDSKVKIKKYHSKLRILENLDLSDFNKQNYAAAYTVCRILGLSEEQIVRGMKSFQLPKGRLEVVYKKDFTAIIDFAHTPNAFRVLLPEIKKKYLKKGARLIHVFGCAGLRDFTKRPLMGEISAQYSDIIVLTEEDYRTEDINKINDQIERGINKIKENKKQLKVFKIINRQKAIDKAFILAKEGDVVLITGKSHEKSLCRGKKEYFWDDFTAVRGALKKVNFLKTNNDNF